MLAEAHDLAAGARLLSVCLLKDMRTCSERGSRRPGDEIDRETARRTLYTHTHTHTHTHTRARARALKEKVDLAMKSIKVSELQPLLERICP